MNNGFTLIELMLVLGIIALFATFSYPSYRESITKSRRIDGQMALINLASHLENYYSKHQTYQGATLGTGSETDVSSSSHSPQNWYLLAITTQTDRDYSLQAIPRGVQALNDKLCQTFNFDSQGRKTVSTGKTKQCW